MHPINHQEPKECNSEACRDQFAPQRASYWAVFKQFLQKILFCEVSLCNWIALLLVLVFLFRPFLVFVETFGVLCAFIGQQAQVFGKFTVNKAVETREWYRETARAIIEDDQLLSRTATISELIDECMHLDDRNCLDYMLTQAALDGEMCKKCLVWGEDFCRYCVSQ